MMTARDPYDPVVAFDDIYGGEDAYQAPIDVRRAAWAVIDQAKRKRLGVTPVEVVGAAVDTTLWSFESPVYVVGEGERGAGGASGLVLFDGIKDRFSGALPKPKLVRVDDEASYAEFRNARRAPYLAKLEERLAAVERTLEGHIADNHGGGRLAALEDRFTRHVADEDARLDALEERFVEHVHDPRAHVLGALEGAVYGGTKVHLPLKEAREGKIDCWRDGKELLCTVRLRGKDGRVRMATTGQSVEHPLAEVLGYALSAGLDVEETLAVAPPMAEILGCTTLIGELCGAARELVACAGSGTYVGTLQSATDPMIAATMALIQRCQGGDRRAMAELSLLYRANPALCEDALERLVRGQHEKRKQRRMP